MYGAFLRIPEKELGAFGGGGGAINSRRAWPRTGCAQKIISSYKAYPKYLPVLEIVAGFAFEERQDFLDLHGGSGFPSSYSLLVNRWLHQFFLVRLYCIPVFPVSLLWDQLGVLRRA